jgi:hypothetical protein
MRKEPVRVNIKLSADTNKWVEDYAHEIGLNKSALITVCVENFRKEIEAGREYAMRLYEQQEASKDKND